MDAQLLEKVAIRPALACLAYRAWPGVTDWRPPFTTGCQPVVAAESQPASMWVLSTLTGWQPVVQRQLLVAILYDG